MANILKTEIFFFSAVQSGYQNCTVGKVMVITFSKFYTILSESNQTEHSL